MIMKLKKVEPTNYWMSDMFPTRFEDLVKSFFDSDVSEVHPREAFFRPSTDIKENDDRFEIVLAIPGIQREDVKIELSNGVLEVSGERKQEHEEHNDKWHLSEMVYGKFSRRFNLPDQVDAERIDAQVKDGILRVIVPKSEEKKPKMIDIK